MAYEELETLPRGLETPNVYGPADAPLSVQESQLIGSVRKNDKAFIQDLVRTSQPQQAVGIDWSNPITRGLMVAYDGLGNDAVSNSRFTNITNGVGAKGRGQNVSGLTTIPSLSGLAVPDQSSVTFLVALTHKTIPSGYCGLFGKWDELNYHRLSIGFYNNTLQIGNYPSANVSIGSSAAAGYHVYAGSLNSNGDYIGCVDAVVSATGNAGSRSFTGGNDSWRLGCWRGSELTENANGVYHVACAWNRALSTSELRSISQNPWQIFKPIPAKLKHYIPQQPILPSKVGIPGLIEQSKRPWANQPQGPVQIDWSNPITRGLVSAINPTSAYSGEFGLSALQTKKFGRSHIGGSNTYISQATPLFVNAASILHVGNLEYSSAGNNTFSGIGTSGSGNQLFAFQGSASSQAGRAVIRLIDGGGISSAEVDTSPSGTSGPEAVWIATYNGTNILNVFQDGRYCVSSRLNTAAFGVMSSMDNFTLGGINRGLNSFSQAGQISTLSVAWNRVLSDAEIQSISQNPWQIFKPLSYKQFVGQNTLPNIQVYREKLMWTSQPQQAVGIDWDNPITRGLLVAVIGDQKVNCANSRMLQISSGVSSGAPSRRGVGINMLATASTSRLTLTTGESVVGLSAVSALTVVDVIVSGNSDSDGQILNGYTSYNSCSLLGVESYSSQTQAHSKVAFSPTYSNLYPAGFFVAGDNITAVVRAASGRTHDVFRNGILKASQTVASGSTITDGGSGNKEIASITPGTKGSCVVQLRVHWGRFLEDAEVASLSANPWQIFKPIPRRIENRTPAKPQPLLPKQYVAQGYTQQPFQANNFGANVIASVGVSNNNVWNGKTGQKITPLIEGVFTKNLYSTPSGGDLAKVWSVPVLFRIQDPFTIMITWEHSNDMSGEYTRYLYSLAGLIADAFNLAGPDYTSFRRYYIACSANYTGQNGPLGANTRLPPYTRITTVIKSEGKGRNLYIYDNVGDVLVAAAPTSNQYSSHQVRNLEFFSFKNGTFSIGSFAMWDKAFSDDLCYQLTRNPGLAFSSTGYPARLK